MMGLVFLVCWTLLFMGMGLLIHRCLVHRIRAFVLIVLNLFFLTTLFWLYPLVLALSHVV